LVEQGTENPRVGSSILSLATIKLLPVNSHSSAGRQTCELLADLPACANDPPEHSPLNSLRAVLLRQGFTHHQVTWIELDTYRQCLSLCITSPAGNACPGVHQVGNRDRLCRTVIGVALRLARAPVANAAHKKSIE
jgi:hypothetical protein